MTLPWLSARHHEHKRERLFRDPVTGDQLTLAEEISWQVQTRILRRWSFLLIFTAVTAVMWLLGPTVQFDWNLGASWLAIIVEGTVGLAMFSQTRRDALILRKIKELEEAHLDADRRRDAQTLELAALIRSVMAAPESAQGAQG